MSDSDNPQNHPNLEIRKLDSKLSENWRKQRDLEVEISTRSSAPGGLTDRDRLRYHNETIRNLKEKDAILQSIQAVDPTFRTAAIGQERNRIAEERQASERARNKLLP
jgi:hypothetical protein